MKLRRRIGLLLGSVALLLGALVGAGLEATLMPSFLRLEREHAQADLMRVVQALERELVHLGTTARDWGVWDETYNFVAGKNEGFVAANAYEGFQEPLDICIFQLHDRQGRLLIRACTAPAEFQGVELRELAAQDLPSDHPLLRGPADREALKVLLATSWGPMLLCSQPVLMNNSAGEPIGTLLMGRALDLSARAELAAETKVDFELIRSNPNPVASEPTRFQTAALLQEQPRLVLATDTLLTSAHLRDVLGNVAYLLETQAPRSIVASGRQAVGWSWGLLFLVGLVLILFLDHWLSRQVVAPLQHFTTVALGVRKRSEAERLLDMNRPDELGALARRFAQYLEEHERFEQRLTDASHQAGMAEVATAVLHNVGNLLNGVTVSSALLHDQLTALPARELSALAERLSQDRPELSLSGAQAEGLRTLLRLVADRFQSSSRLALAECQRIADRVHDVSSLVASQQSLAGSGDFEEILNVEELLDIAVRVALPPRSRVEVRRAARSSISLRINRHKLLQVLVNLIKNASEAYEGESAGRPWLALTVEIRGQHLELGVEDGGQGIAVENLTAIFQHGFTTKAKGHGFGLHSAAAAAKEMGGSLNASSLGRGLGACFTLELPCDRVLAAGEAPVEALDFSASAARRAA